MLSEARAERDRVNATFLKTSSDMEQEQKGFGVNFWGATWRFRMMEELYGQPATPAGLMRCNVRYSNLKRRLAAVRDGTDTWVHDIMASDPKIRSEIANPEAVKDFCGAWLAHLIEHEQRMAEEGLAAEADALAQPK
jgi:hypothetical protein